MCGGCFYGCLMATNLLYPMQSPPSCSTHCSVVTVCSSAANSQICEHHSAVLQSSLVIFSFCNQFTFPTCLDLSLSLGEISCRLHLALWRSRVPRIHHSRSSLCGFSCHFGSVLYKWCLPSGATHAGEYILPGHWKENLTSAMLILAVMSSSICGNTKHWVKCHF